ncbi:MAG TPA: SMP-30/gluconolactonase/LRE family protein [Paraburkholderia sp.]|nr:SMP-30/gluconolactonase/LRE family protein [Paraburkholderia sp.]
MQSHEFEVNDARFRRLIQPNALLKKLTRDCLWTEGPVYFPAADLLIWSDIPNNRMLRWAPGMGIGVFRSPSGFSNGNTRDREGRLVTCEHGERRVTRTEHDGRVVELASRFEGKRFNSPNDVVVDSRGVIWFTDPDYGILGDYEGHRAESEIGRCNVYRVSPDDGRVHLVTDDFVKPNGLAFSPDESLLYIADSGATHDDNAPRHIRAFDVARDGVLSNPRVLIEMQRGVPDGFRVDEQGNIWTSAEDGVHCYMSDGTLLGKILIPEVVSNLTFGGASRNRMFITATTSVYALFLCVRGAGV